MAETFLRLKQVKARVPLSTATIYNRMSQGTFPRPIPLGGRLVAWLASDIDAWIEALLDEHRGQSAATVVEETQPC